VTATKSAASTKKLKTASHKSGSPARTSAAGKKAAKKAAPKVVKKPARKKAAPKAAKKPAREAAVRKKTTGKAAGKKVARKAPAKKAAGRRVTKPARGRITKKIVQPSEEAAARSRQEAEEYQQALAVYGTCLELLQKRDWEGASRALADFVSHHGRESELAQRARTYLRVCAQHLDSKSVQPKDFNDRCYTAVILANKQERPRSSQAHYLKASTLALKGERRGALDALKTAIEMEDRNRIYAANNPDFAGLRDDEEFITLTTREDEEY